MDTKQVIVIRRDLKMRRGKEIAQGGHACMQWLVYRYQRNQNLSAAEEDWLKNSHTKVCLQVDSEAALLEVYEKAKAVGLSIALVTDLGRTEFHGVPTNTCLAIGPDESAKIDAITGHLKLY